VAKDGVLSRETGLSAVAQQPEGLPVPDRLFGPAAAAIYDPGRKARASVRSGARFPVG
jgi:hypothetical protein